jgi:LemA protein
LGTQLERTGGKSLSTPFLVIFGLAAGVVIWGIAVYNNLVKQRNLKDEAWSGIDVQLTRRADLIPNLLETVKGYMEHEKDVLKAVTEARARVGSAATPADRIKAEAALGVGLGRLLAVAESYPDLKANANFLELQKQLEEIEDHLQMARRYYNGTVRHLNTSIQIFPNSVVASMFHFEEADFFEIDDPSDRQVPEVKF